MEFAPAELALVLEVHPLAGRALIADSLDLRHRLPCLFSLTTDELRVPDWVARKIARMTRHLDPATAAVIDARIAGDTDDAATLPPSRLFALVEGLVTAADNATRDDERDKARARRFVTISDHQAEPGTTGIYGCIDDAGGLALEATITRLAQCLADAGDDDPVDVRRAKALVLLATPTLALQHLLGLVPTSSTADDDSALAAALAAIDPAKLAPTAVLYLHLTDQTLFAATASKSQGSPAEGVARWEGVGPITLAHLTELLEHHNVVVKPVSLPAEHRAADSYEYTGSLREAVLLLHPRDVYPYAVGATRRHTAGVDIDHNDAYDDTGPPGQTSVRNAGPMLRHHHRIKTHGRIRVRQPVPGTYVWGSRHGIHKMTDNTGTHDIDADLGKAALTCSLVESQLATVVMKYQASSWIS
jgi:hypothetical protein